MTHPEIDPAAEARRALEAALYECKRVVVGQDAMLERLLVALLTGGHVLLEGVPGLAKTLTVRTLAHGAGRQLRPHPVHARPRARRPRRHAPVAAGRRQLPHRARPGVRQPAARRRDQPRARQGPVRAARGDAGAPGHDRRRDAPRARAVPRARHAEPDRVRGHLRPARGAGRPLPVQARGRLPERRGRDRGRRPRVGADAARRARRWRSTSLLEHQAGRARGVRRPLDDRLRGHARRRHAPPRPLRARRPRAADPVRRQPARVARPGPGRAGARAAARPHARASTRTSATSPADVLRHRLVLSYDALADGVRPDDADRPRCSTRSSPPNAVHLVEAA